MKSKRRDEPTLKRSLGFWTLAAYGIGDILGAGVYALVGKIAGVAGEAAWIAFLAAMLAASLTALSYAELGGRFPRSGSEPYYCRVAFGRSGLAVVIGWLVFASGVVSLATMSHAFAGYLLQDVTALPWVLESAVLAGFLLVLAGLNFWGMRQSSMTNVVFTLVEVSGLVIVIILGSWYIAGAPEVPALADVPALPAEVKRSAGFLAIAHGVGLAFFAFIGFEDMANVAEEVENPRRNLPAAIVVALVVAGILYVAVAWISTSVVPPAELSMSGAPLLAVVERASPSFPPWVFTIIALFAVANTGLLNSITGSRLLYGMSRDGLLPAGLRRVHRRTQTPYRAIAIVLAAALVLSLSGTLVYLAGTTSALLLLVFTAVNASLLRIKVVNPAGSGFRVPALVPGLGVIVSFTLFFFVPLRSVLVALALLLVGCILLVPRARGREGLPGDS